MTAIIARPSRMKQHTLLLGAVLTACTILVLHSIFSSASISRVSLTDELLQNQPVVAITDSTIMDERISYNTTTNVIIISTADDNNATRINARTIIPPVVHPPMTFRLRNRTNVTIPSHVTRFYVIQRMDRAGAALWRNLNAHAFCFNLRMGNVDNTTITFGGACGSLPHSKALRARRVNQVKLVQALGLDQEVPLIENCPSPDDTSAMIMNDKYYFEWDGRMSGFGAFTLDWTKHMRHLMSSFLGTTTKPSTKTIVVHIRRGDVEPCDIYTRQRYLTNRFYLDLIQDYALQFSKNGSEDYKVIVHSQNRSFEHWSDFQSSFAATSLGNNNTNGTGAAELLTSHLELKLDVPVEEAFRDMINADVFVMSKSSFSQAAALFNINGKVVCIPMSHHCHSRWIRVDNMQERAETMRLNNLISSRCRGKEFDSRKLNKTEQYRRTGELPP